MAPYDLRITPEGLRHLDRLPAKIREAALAALHGPIRENPRRLGKPLVGELDGLLSSRRGDYRIVYGIDEGTHTVVVHRVQHRARLPPEVTRTLSGAAYVVQIARIGGGSGYGTLPRGTTHWPSNSTTSAAVSKSES